jgi:5'-deoxynucleotidase YfbR-like HD superfamily hydrolase
MAKADHDNGRPRAWQRMLSGRRLDLLDPSPDDIEIDDIAHGLARVARWNGQTVGAHAFSVAQHSLLVERIYETVNPGASSDNRLACLLHDAPEYVIGDLISPFKAAIGLDYRAFEHRLLGAIHRRFGLPAELPKPVVVAIKAADSIAAYFEATRLAGFSVDEATRFFGPPPEFEPEFAATLASLQPDPANTVQFAFVERFRELAAASGLQ